MLLLLCVTVLPLLLQLLLLLLLAAAVHRVPDSKISCWFIESDSSVFFPFIQTRFFYPPLGSTVVAFTASICRHPR